MSVRLILVLWVAQVMGDCDRPPLLVNGFLGEEFLSSTSFPVGARVVYECYPGYVFQDGRSTITYCMENSTWTSLQATCEPRNCGNPGEIENGYSQASGTDRLVRATRYAQPVVGLVRPQHVQKILLQSTTLKK
ncbi:complement decay-accelerating factor transmembrane isoform-like isoform X4 [Scyliorhinus canicula]|uniref:complement decay-accelerating factor transmembrane isoform-like isoform X4 n=1 Tax=Scyliorhinus canicula TaxID=7830 RepID=UPI0018F53F13|nr:complement decay-accelerating factor transmembrane isoform-like isoform X4 [Scyliorhinus canicula]